MDVLLTPQAHIPYLSEIENERILYAVHPEFAAHAGISPHARIFFLTLLTKIPAYQRSGCQAGIFSFIDYNTILYTIIICYRTVCRLSIWLRTMHRQCHL